MNYKGNTKNFVKLHRKILNWKWYKDSNTKDLFIHCLLSANWEPGEWNGIEYRAGEFITSFRSLADETGMSVQNVRTALRHLESTGEITQNVTYKPTQGNSKGRRATCSLITVKNWEKYQGKPRASTRKSTQNVATVIENKRKEGLPEGSASSEEEWFPQWEDPSIALERYKKEH